MTEAEWFACNELDDVIDFWWNQPNTRKLRLVAAALCRRVQHLGDHETQAFIAVTEQYADGLLDMAWVRALHQSLRPTRHDHVGEVYRAAVWCLGLCPPARSVLEVSAAAHDAIRVSEGKPARSGNEALVPEDAVQLAILRDVFGNPFRPVTFAPEWRTDTAVAIARQMYESRDFAAMPILADALQDAGCDNTDILDHCRGADNGHVRGCWVVDLVLGKE